MTAYNPAFITSSDSQEELLATASTADAVLLRLLGGKQAMPELFDPLISVCQARGVPLIACPGHEEWDQDLVSACSAPPAGGGGGASSRQTWPFVPPKPNEFDNA